MLGSQVGQYKNSLWEVLQYTAAAAATTTTSSLLHELFTSLLSLLPFRTRTVDQGASVASLVYAVHTVGLSERVQCDALIFSFTVAA